VASQSRKHRGLRTQKVVAEELRSIYPYAEPTGAGRSGKDILSTPGISIEVKARTDFDPMAWVRQAVKEAANHDEIPIVVMRPNGMGETTVDQWPAFMPLSFLKRLLVEAGYGCGASERKG
jgi:hypothetical protein